MWKATALTFANHDEANYDDDDQCQHFGYREDILNTSCPFHIHTVDGC